MSDTLSLILLLAGVCVMPLVGVLWLYAALWPTRDKRRAEQFAPTRLFRGK